MDLNTWLLVGVLILSVVGIIIVRISFDVSRLERKLDAVLKHSGIDIRAIAEKEAVELARMGRKIEAIKVYREYSGVGLAEAKAAIERLQLGGQGCGEDADGAVVRHDSTTRGRGKGGVAKLVTVHFFDRG